MMKKIMVIFAAVALFMAAAGVYAGTLNTFVDWKHTIDAAACSGIQVSHPPGCNFIDLNKCTVIELVGEEEVTFYFSRQELNENGQQIECLQYKEP